uniref:AMIN domain-containing protein n=1 Tax=Conchiformibius kuhniae TaxID=211502 RepID=A0A8T9MWJ0_9NEIS|nr:AMIN domain-containing protein [Conchiformibius kuhniae]
MAKLSRRVLLGASAGGLLVMALGSRAAGNRFVAVRIASDRSYTRVSVEADGKLRYKYFMLENPYRLVVDVEDADLNPVLGNMAGKLPANDPYIANIRTAQKDGNTVRIVFDLKRRVLPKVFGLQPEAMSNTAWWWICILWRWRRSRATRFGRFGTAANRLPMRRYRQARPPSFGDARPRTRRQRPRRHRAQHPDS